MIGNLRKPRSAVPVALIVLSLLGDSAAFAGRGGGGRGGGGGGGGFRGGGGGYGGGGGGFRGGYGGGMPSGGFSRAPSFSAPRANPGAQARPNYGGGFNPGAARPNYGGGAPGAGRPNIGAGGAGRPGVNPGTPGGGRPGVNPGGPGRPGGGPVAGPGGGRPGVNPGGPGRPGVNPGGPGRPGGPVAGPGARPGGPGRPGAPGTRNVNINNNRNNVNVNRINYNRPGYGGYGAYGGYGRPGGPGYGRPGGPGYAPGYRPGWGYHRGWVNGFWGGPGWGGGGWGWGSGFGWGMASGMAFGGLLGWGLGSSLYGMGYSSYANPYYSQALYAQPVVVADAGYAPQALTSSYDYSQPINTETPPPDDSVADPAVAQFDEARAAFMAGDYPKALTLTDQALKTLPNDAAIHEFRALTLFALKQYDYAAGTLYAVLAVGPGWDWTTMIRLYPNIDTYTAQLRALETYRDSNPNSASAHFVLAYHYLTQGHNDAAVGELKEVTRLKPDDRLAKQLTSALSGPQPGTSPGAVAGATPPTEPAYNDAQAAVATNPDGTPVEEPEPSTVPSAEAVSAAAAATQGGPTSKIQPLTEAAFVGSWKATPAANVTIELAIQPDKKFTWSVTDKGQTRKFDGEYTYGGDTLTLVQTNGTAMVGKLAWPDETHFNFRIAGTTADDPGLNFAR